MIRTVSTLALLIWPPTNALLAAEKPPETPRPLVETICPLMEKEAREEGISPMLFVRLIWRESSFRPNLVSHKGAQGIAQFMPETAKERGLVDPFDPIEAISHSARFLADLQREFGNFGLAAAAYNGGPARVRDWLAGQRGLPAETRAYVQYITGHPVEKWKDVEGALPLQDEQSSDGLQAACIKRAPKLLQVALTKKEPQPSPPTGPARPWGVQLGVNFSQARVASLFGELKKRYGGIIGDAAPMFVTERNLSRGRRAMVALRLGAETRDEALKLCQRLRSNGGVCTVEKN
jgi:hypothetical protein